MSKIHPMSEKPRPHENIVITIRDDDDIMFDGVRTGIIDNEIRINTSLEGFGDRISWDKYVNHNTSPEDNFEPTGWQYLSEIINPWTSVEDGLPEEWEDKFFNIYCPGLAKDGWEPIMVATFTDEILFHAESYGDCHKYVTYWQPIVGLKV